MNWNDHSGWGLKSWKLNVQLQIGLGVARNLGLAQKPWLKCDSMYSLPWHNPVITVCSSTCSWEIQQVRLSRKTEALSKGQCMLGEHCSFVTWSTAWSERHFGVWVWLRHGCKWSSRDSLNSLLWLYLPKNEQDLTVSLYNVSQFGEILWQNWRSVMNR